jgi:2-polyprenyl-3-methyl-5-hydroxy-6-metoxy-1,4-benzoquinol methylase
MRKEHQNEYVFAGEAGEQSHRYLLPGVAAVLASYASSGTGDQRTLVDMGCGNGAMTSALQGFTKKIGLEMSESGLAIARVAHPSVEFISCDLCQPIVAPELINVADVVVSTEVIEHVFLPRHFITNANKILRPGGLLVLSTPYHGYLKNLAIAAVDGFDNHWMPLWDYGHIKFWSRRTLTMLVEECGFEVVDFRGVGRAPFLWKSMILSAVKR